MPSPFTGSLRLTSLDADCRIWRLDEEMRYEVGSLGSGALIIVPPGFETDGASIPRLLQGVLPAWGRWSRAAIIHDYLCRGIDRGEPVSIARALPGHEAVHYGKRIYIEAILDRARADSIFHEALIVCDVPRLLAWLMWAAVRLADRFPALRVVNAV